MIVDHRTDNVKIGKLAEFLNLYETDAPAIEASRGRCGGSGMILLPDFRD